MTPEEIRKAAEARLAKIKAESVVELDAATAKENDAKAERERGQRAFTQALTAARSAISRFNNLNQKIGFQLKLNNGVSNIADRYGFARIVIDGTPNPLVFDRGVYVDVFGDKLGMAQFEINGGKEAIGNGFSPVTEDQVFEVLNEVLAKSYKPE